jgi:hypothetical protein
MSGGLRCVRQGSPFLRVSVAGAALRGLGEISYFAGLINPGRAKSVPSLSLIFLIV